MAYPKLDNKQLEELQFIINNDNSSNREIKRTQSIYSPLSSNRLIFAKNLLKFSIF